MLSLYRRHPKSCKYSEMPNPQEFTKCGCPIWAYGYVDGRETRRSMRERDWKRATEKLLTMNEQGLVVVTLREAVEAFIAERRRRKKAESTIESHQKAFVHLLAMYGSKSVSAITVEMLDRLQAGRVYQPNKKGSEVRPIEPSTMNKELKSIRALFTFARKRKWTAENPAKDVEMADEDGLPTLPFSADEIDRIIAACDVLDSENPLTRDLNRAKARARVLLLLYSGMRVSDTVRLERSRVDLSSGKLLIRMTKTRQPLYIRLPDDALAALKELPADSPYFLWSGKSTMHTATSNARKSLQRVGKLAGVENVHPHRFRDTFSVELLKGGATLHTVQVLLGHKSIRTTEKHYAPYVVEFQEIVDTATSRLAFGTRTRNRTDIGESTKTP